MKDKILCHVYTTKDYGKFKFLEENREVKKRRVKKIKDSISDVGYVLQPILVNEKMEIIDGQGRFNACVELELPILYMVEEGRGIEECRRLNLGQENWTTWDWVNSYADGGNVDYQRFRTFVNGSQLSMDIILPLPFGWCVSNVSARSAVKDGRLHFSKATLDKVKWEADYLERFIPISKKMKGRKTNFFGALVYAYRNFDIPQRNRLFDVVEKNSLISEMYSSVELNLKAFDSAYNKGLQKSNRINLELLFRTDSI